MRYCKEGIGEKIVDIVGSISEINAARYDEATMLANYGHIPPTLKTPEEIVAAAREVKKEIADLPGREGLYLRGMLDAFEEYARILAGEDISYIDAIEVMQQVRLRPVPREKYEALSAKTGERLEELGYTGTVGQKVRAYLADTALQADKVTEYANSLLALAKAKCEERVVVMAGGDGINKIGSVRGVFWSGNSRYIDDFRGELTFNIDRPWSVPTFANVLCHEGYPGHQAFYSHWDDLYRQGRLPLEAAYYSTAGNPADPMFEGSPETALHFLGWDDFDEDTPEITDEQKKTFILGRDILDLQRFLQMQACYMYHVEGASMEEAVAYMLKDGIFSRIEAENTCRFFTHPVQRYYYPCYYYGYRLVSGCYREVPKEKRQEFFRILYDRPHTNETLIREVSELIGKEIDPLKEW